MKKWISLLFSCSLFANIGPQGFAPFAYNRVFVETGTFKGDGVVKALGSGFAEVYSIEFLKSTFKKSSKRFKNMKNVHLFLGDSAVSLWSIIEGIHEPITFWLDGHVCPPRQDGGPNCPLLKELDQIKRHPIKTHTILIDDMHCCSTILFDGISKKQLIEKILEINPKYKISFVPGGDNGEYPENVLVAEIYTERQ